MRKNKLILFGLILALCASQLVSGQARITPLNIKERTLANGLRVVSLQDNSSPSVTVQVWYDVGSKNDPEGRNGFAHLFEHIMFKSTKNMKNEMMDRLTEDVGGFNNASTNDDVTNYYEVIPSNYLETLIWAEAERMSNLNVDETNFKSERAVVQEEFRQSVLAQPYGQFYEYIQKRSFNTHPYKRTTIGTIEDLDAATVADVRNFHSTYYRPDNATLIVVGDFDQAQFDAWVDKYFNRVAKPKSSIPRVTLTEPERTESKHFDESAPNVPLPAVAITYLAPPAADKDTAALKVAEQILSGGESSRLYQQLVYKQQIAQEASFSVDDHVDKGLLYFIAKMADGKKPEEGEKSLLAELKKIQMRPPTAVEVTRAKNGIIADALRTRETNQGKAFAIGRAVILKKDAQAVNKDLGQIQAVTAADVQRVMKKYFNDKNRVVIYYRGAEGGQQ